MYPDENTLTESIAASCSTGDSESSTSGDEELDDSEDKGESQWKLHGENDSSVKKLLSSSYKCFLPLNAFFWYLNFMPF